MKKTSIASLVTIYKNCQKEGRDSETTFGQVAGEVYWNTRDNEIARRVASTLITEARQYKNLALRQNLRAIHNLLIWKFPAYLYSTQN
jgi:hypothetical protein